MPRPSADLEEFRGAMVNYGDAMTMLFWGLKAPRPGMNLFQEEGALGFWSEHSELDGDAQCHKQEDGRRGEDVRTRVQGGSRAFGLLSRSHLRRTAVLGTLICQPGGSSYVEMHNFFRYWIQKRA